MMSFSVREAAHVEGEVCLSGDKSIAHRAIIISAITPGKTIIENFPANKDCLATLKVLQRLGVRISRQAKTKGKTTVCVFGKGLGVLKEPPGPIFVGDSGATLRLILGVLAGCDFKVRLIAGKSLTQRPMLRVTRPLRMMGAFIKSKIKKSLPAGRQEKSKIEEYPPITIRGGNLRAITYKMPVASAQVKSAILLAGLYAKGSTRVIEPVKTRDHTERMLKLFKAGIKVQGNKIVIKRKPALVSPGKIAIAGDISSASFFMVLAALLPQAKILLKNVSLNPSRSGIIRVLKRMGADIKVKSQKSKVKSYEPMGDLIVRSSRLKGTVVKKEEIPSLIDELPILMVAASKAKGRTVLEGIGELRVKETDRLRAMHENLSKMGAKIRVSQSGKSENILIQGVKELKGSRVNSFGDHRTAMSMVIAGLAGKGKTVIDDVSCISKSFPGFLSTLKPLIR